MRDRSDTPAPEHAAEMSSRSDTVVTQNSPVDSTDTKGPAIDGSVPHARARSGRMAKTSNGPVIAKGCGISGGEMHACKVKKWNYSVYLHRYYLYLHVG